MKHLIRLPLMLLRKCRAALRGEPPAKMGEVRHRRRQRREPRPNGREAGRLVIPAISYSLLVTGLIYPVINLGCRSPLPETKILPAPVEEKIIWSSHPQRPEWTVQEPEVKESELFFVGLSGKSAMEKDARDDAQRDAIKKVVGYIGTDVKDRFERLTTSAGLSTEVIDPTKVMRNFEEQFSQAMTRRVKPSIW